MNIQCFYRMIDNKSSISIVGCGWLGTPLAQTFLQDGMIVKGSTTSQQKTDLLKGLGIKPYLLKLPSETTIEPALFDADFLVINLPPGRRNPNVVHDYPAAIGQISDAVKTNPRIKKIIFISSTSVYGESLNIIDETTPTIPETESGRALVRAEALIEDIGKSYVLLRFGGLAGPGRHPGRFLAGKSGLFSGDQVVNFLHLDDAIGVIRCFINDRFEQEIFNVVSPMHPRKKDFYNKMSEMLGLEPPDFNSSTGGWKREISTEKLMQQTNYEFKFLNPMACTF